MAGRDQDQLLSHLQIAYRIAQDHNCLVPEDYENTFGPFEEKLNVDLKSLEEDIEAPKSELQGRDSQDLVDELHKARRKFERIQEEILQQFLKEQREKDKKKKLERITLYQDILKHLGTRKSKPSSSQDSGFYEDISSFKNSQRTQTNPRSKYHAARKTLNGSIGIEIPTPPHFEEVQDESHKVSEDTLQKASNKDSSSSRSSNLGSIYLSERRDFSQSPKRTTSKEACSYESESPQTPTSSSSNRFQQTVEKNSACQPNESAQSTNSRSQGAKRKRNSPQTIPPGRSKRERKPPPNYTKESFERNEEEKRNRVLKRMSKD